MNAAMFALPAQRHPVIIWDSAQWLHSPIPICQYFIEYVKKRRSTRGELQVTVAGHRDCGHRAREPAEDPLARLTGLEMQWGAVGTVAEGLPSKSYTSRRGRPCHVAIGRLTEPQHVAVLATVGGSRDSLLQRDEIA